MYSSAVLLPEIFWPGAGATTFALALTAGTLAAVPPEVEGVEDLCLRVTGAVPAASAEPLTITDVTELLADGCWCGRRLVRRPVGGASGTGGVPLDEREGEYLEAIDEELECTKENTLEEDEQEVPGETELAEHSVSDECSDVGGVSGPAVDGEMVFIVVALSPSLCAEADIVVVSS